MATKQLLYRFPMLILVAIFLVSCTRSCRQSNEKEQPIAIAVDFPIESLDPRYATSAIASRISKLVYAPLFELGEDASPKPFLAESIEALDEKTFKIELRKNLKFHNGTPLTTHDVLYTYDQLKSPDVASPHGEKFDYVDKIIVVDDTHITFELKEPHAPFLTDLCAIGIVSKKACEKRSQQCRHEHIGSGPYTLTSWDTAKEAIHLSPFADWFEGEPKKDLLFRVVRDENIRVLELMGKKTDIVDDNISPANSTLLKKQNHLSIRELPGLGYRYLAINVRGPQPQENKDSAHYRTRLALANKQVRKAIAHAIDFDQIIEKLLLGTAKRVSGLIPNGHWAKDKNLKPPPFDPGLAENELDKAGFKRIGPDNMRFKLTIATIPNRLRQSITELYADFLKRVGIDASIRVKDFSALYQDMKLGQFELVSAIWVPVTDPDLYYFVHHSSSIPEGDKAGGNRHGYKNEEIDRLIVMGRTTMEPEKRKLIYQEIERRMIEDLPYIPLWNEHRIVIFNKERIHGFEPSVTGSLLGLRNAYMDSLTKRAKL